MGGKRKESSVLSKLAYCGVRLLKLERIPHPLSTMSSHFLGLLPQDDYTDQEQLGDHHQSEAGPSNGGVGDPFQSLESMDQEDAEHQQFIREQEHPEEHGMGNLEQNHLQHHEHHLDLPSQPQPEDQPPPVRGTILAHRSSCHTCRKRKVSIDSR